jgi:D-glycero-D-manno-heptose 1,7-bisphosphate phosphatase
MPARRFVILDRDGTIMVHRPYLCDPEAVELIAGAADALCALRAMGLGLVIVTNQSGIGRGLFDAARLAQVHERLERLLQASGCRVDGIYVCPHSPDDGCACRKPADGLVMRAAAELGFSPRSSFVVGDNVCDIELGRRLRATTFLVRTGHGAGVAAERGARADHVVDGIADVVPVIRRLAARRQRVAA